MPPAKKPKASEPPTNAPSAPLQPASGNSGTAKRKHADASNAATSDSENDQTRKQPRQDNSPDRNASSTSTANSREILFGIPQLSFQSPFEGDMCLEVATPSVKYAQGCIRLHGPEGHWNMDAVFSLPFASIETVIIMRNRKRSAGKKNAYEVLIVPTAATGIAPVSRRPAQIIAFILPDQKIDDQVYGSIASGVDKSTLVLSLFKNALNERLAEFSKTVIDLSKEDEKSNPIFRIETTLEPVNGTKLEKKTKGLLQFLNGGGVLFRAKGVTLYIPVQQLNTVRLVFATEMKNGIVGTDLVLSVPNPLEATASSETRGGREYALLGFHGLSRTLAKFICHFAEKHNIKVQLNQQHFYNYAKNQPMSGWSDLPPGLKEKLIEKVR
ncbi:hypothetical protein F4825DRAFT_468059 [Nemania diffusa]|nr:hypothetical protein F4825DRAFT_468059 [Nemania diffusa]